MTPSTTTRRRAALARPKARRLSVLVALTCTGAIGSAAAQTVTAPSWTLQELGSLNVTGSTQARAINNLGQVAGVSDGNLGARAVVWTNGVPTNLGASGGFGATSYATAINDAGQVAGNSVDQSGNSIPFSWAAGTRTDLFRANYPSGVAQGINSAGTVVGYLYDLGVTAAQWSAGYGSFVNTTPGYNAYAAISGNLATGYQLGGTGTLALVRNLSTATTTVLPTAYAGPSVGNYGLAINDAGQVAGYATGAGGALDAVLWQNGSATVLPRLAGTSTSIARGISAQGYIVGQNGTSGSPLSAVLWRNGTVLDLNTLRDASWANLTLKEAYGINDRVQIVGNGTDSAGRTRGFVLSLDTTVYQGPHNSGWGSAANWAFGILPTAGQRTVLDAAANRTVFGPSDAATVRTLQIGGDPALNAATTQLQLVGSRITAVGDGVGPALTITPRGVLAGVGSLYDPSDGGFDNNGRIVVDNIGFSGGTVNNRGIVEGNGRLATDNYFFNLAGGTLRLAQPGQRLQIDGLALNQGRIEAVRGEIEVTQVLTSTASGRITLRDGTLRSAYTINDGQLDVSSGTADVFGELANNGRLVVSGQGRATFWDGLGNRGEFRVSEGAVATVFQQFVAGAGGTLTGTGLRFFEGTYSTGSQTSLVQDSASVGFGSGARLKIGLGGTTPGAGAGHHDKLMVGGTLTLGGTLQLLSWEGYTAEAGQVFDILDWATLAGSFASIDSSGLQLAPDAQLDFSRLYLDGTIRVTAVPEPAGWALMVAGLALLRVRRHGRRHGQRAVRARS